MPSPPLVLRGWPLKMWMAASAAPTAPAGVARRRLNPDVFERAVAQHLAVGDAIERHAAGEAQVLRTGFLGEAARQPQHGFVQHRLDGGRNIHVKRRSAAVRGTHRLAEQLCEALVGHGQAGAIIEIRHVEPERAVRL